MAIASRQPAIATRTSRETKAKFAALAASRGMNESSLLTLLVDAVLERNSAEAFDQGPADDDPSCKRITLRLRPGDHVLVEARATARHMKPASYLVMLVHAHVRRHPPMPLDELNALKLAVSQLSMTGRGLHSLAYSGEARSDVERIGLLVHQTAEQVEDLRSRIADLVRVNLRSWESSDA